MSEQGYRTRVFYIDDRMLAHAYDPAFTPKAKDYRWVLTFNATSPDHAFAMLNRGSGSEAAELDLKRLRSMSMGDIVYQQDLFHLCIAEGWKIIPPSDQTDRLYKWAIAGEDIYGSGHRTWELHLRSCPNCTAAKRLFEMCANGRPLFMAALDSDMTVEELLERRA